ncbi:MAG: response regulator [Candidatus Solibacter sp.]
MNILIVDDESPIRKLLSTCFARSGFAVETASDGADAIALCETNKFDVVLSDVMMPKINGHQLAQFVALNSPTTITVLMSGYDATCEAYRYSPRGTLVAKPFLPQDVVDTVQSLLAQRATATF